MSVLPHQYAWAVWLAVPLLLTVLASLVAWFASWRARPVRKPTTEVAMRLHDDYLEALTYRASGAVRVERATEGSHSGS